MRSLFFSLMLFAATLAWGQVDGICYADQFAGSDISAKISAAYATGACPIIALRANSSYSTASPIVFTQLGQPVIVDGRGASITFTGLGSLFAFDVGQGHTPSIGVENVTLNGNPGATALLLGGTQGADGFKAENVKIYRFGVGVSFSSNTYNVKFDHVIFSENYSAVVIPSGLSNFGEQIFFDHVTFGNTDPQHFTNCIFITAYTGLSLQIDNSLIDNCQVVINPNGKSGQLANITLSEDHFEDPSFAIASDSFIVNNGGANLYLNGVDFMDEKGPLSVQYPITATGGGSIYVNAVRLFTGGNTLALVNLSGSSQRLIVDGSLYHTVTPTVSAIPPWANANSNTTTWLWNDTDQNNVAQTSGIYDFRSGDQGPNSARLRIGNVNGVDAQLSFYRWTGVNANFYSYAVRLNNDELDFCAGGAAPIGSESYNCQIRFTQNGKASLGAMDVGGGATVSKIAKVAVTLSPQQVAAHTCAEQTVTVTGLDAGSYIVSAQKSANQPGLSYGGYRVTGANLLGINFCNDTSLSITPTSSEVWTFWYVR